MTLRKSIKDNIAYFEKEIARYEELLSDDIPELMRNYYEGRSSALKLAVNLSQTALDYSTEK